MHPVVKMVLTAGIITGVIFLEVFACVPDNWIMLVCLLPLLLVPVPLLLLRCCGDSDSFSGSPKAQHWAEFWSAFFFMSTIALPVIFYVTHVVTPKALILSLSGVLLAVTFVACTMFVQRREEADAFHAW